MDDIEKRFWNGDSCAGPYCTDCNGFHNLVEMERIHPDRLKEMKGKLRENAKK